MMQLEIYQYEIRYKKGKENIIGDALSRLQSENEKDTNYKEDYLDIVIAAIDNEIGQILEVEGNEPSNSLEINAIAIASQPSSNINNLYESSLEEQNKDQDIKWIKELILVNKENRPKITQFSNQEQKMLYKEYKNLSDR